MTPEPDELTVAEIETLRVELVAQQERLVAAMDSASEGTKPVDLDEPIGRLSRIDALAQREMNSAGQRAQKQQLDEVRMALDSITAGEYGECRACDGPIGFRRLRARPFTPLCLACQSARENR